MATTRKAATKKAGVKAAGKSAPGAASKKTAAESPVKRFRALVEHLDDSKKPETRRRRLEKSIALLAAGTKGPRG